MRCLDWVRLLIAKLFINTLPQLDKNQLTSIIILEERVDTSYSKYVFVALPVAYLVYLYTIYYLYCFICTALEDILFMFILFLWMALLIFLGSSMPDGCVVVVILLSYSIYYLYICGWFLGQIWLALCSFVLIVVMLRATIRFSLR